MTTASANNVDYAGKLSGVRVSIRPNLEVTRHIFSGEPSYAIRDPVTGQTHRFSAGDYQLLASISQSSTLGDCFAALVARGKLETTHSDDYYRFVVHLHQLGLLSLPLSDGAALHKKFQQRLAAQKKGKIFRLLFWKVPLLRPDSFLSHTAHWARPLFTKTAVIAWLVCVVLTGIGLGLHWKEFIDPLGTMLAVSSLPTLWILLVTLKAFHELGHAYACKHFGGRVPEIGAIFIMGTPCAYVDASSSWGFPNRWHRIVVALAGMYIESILAMVAFVIWLLADGGALKSAAQYAIVLSTVVTIGFNANPLMRFDGYFIFSDLLNKPNLHRDAKKEATNTLKRWLLRVPNHSESTEPSIQRLGLALFGFACMVYQVSVSIGIATLLAVTIPIIGPLVGLVMLAMPMTAKIKSIVKYFRESEELETNRKRVVLGVSICSLAVAISLLCIPIPGQVETRGVFHRSFELPLRAPENGFVEHIYPKSGEDVSPADILIVLDNPELQAEKAQLQSSIQQLRIQLQQTAILDYRTSVPIRLQLQDELDRLRLVNDQINRLKIQAIRPAVFAGTQPELKLGSYVKKGEPLGVLSAGQWTVTAQITAEEWASIQSHKHEPVTIAVANPSPLKMQGTIIQDSTSGTRKVQEAALALSGGGSIAVSEDMLAEENLFVIVVAIDESSAAMLNNLWRPGLSATLLITSKPETTFASLYRKAVRILNRFQLASS